MRFETPNQLLGIYVRKLREGNGWTLEYLAKQSGLGSSTLSLIEHGKRGISIGVLCKLAIAFNVSECSILQKSGYIERFRDDHFNINKFY